MSITWTVSPLSHIARVDEPALRRALGVPDGDRVFVYSSRDAEPFVIKTSPALIRGWWSGVQNRYREQLRQDVTWDEDSAVEKSFDYDAGQAIDLNYLTGYVDKFGEDGVGIDFRVRPRVDQSDKELDGWMRYRGYASRFPQLTVQPAYLLPFNANLVIAAPDWLGEDARFGSLARTAEELEEVLGVIVRADPALADTTVGPGDDRLAHAAQAAREHLRQVREAVRLGLPMWWGQFRGV